MSYSETTDLCLPTTTTRQICQDEVLIEITSVSKDLNSALSFNPGETYYFISKFIYVQYRYLSIIFLNLWMCR